MAENITQDLKIKILHHLYSNEGSTLRRYRCIGTTAMGFQPKQPFANIYFLFFLFLFENLILFPFQISDDTRRAKICSLTSSDENRQIFFFE